MFSDQYKKDNELLQLDDEFLNQLKSKMRAERARLNQDTAQTQTIHDELNSSVTDPITSKKEKVNESNIKRNDVIDFKPKQTNSAWKQALPLALTACAVLAVLIGVPTLLRSSTSKSNEKMYETAQDMTVGTTESTADTTCESASDAKCESSSKPDESTTDSYLADSAQKNKEEDDTTVAGTLQETDGSLAKENGNYAFNADVAESKEAPQESEELQSLQMPASELDFNHEDNFVPDDEAILTNTISDLMTFSAADDQIFLDSVENSRIIFHDLQALYVYNCDTEKLERIRTYGTIFSSDFVLTSLNEIAVTVFHGGNYVLLNNSSQDNYIYNIQTNRIIVLDNTQLANITLPESSTYTELAEDKSNPLIRPKYLVSPWAQSNSKDQLALFYQNSDCKTIASLSICLASQDKDGKLYVNKTLPIFGEASTDYLAKQNSDSNTVVH